MDWQIRLPVTDRADPIGNLGFDVRHLDGEDAAIARELVWDAIEGGHEYSSEVRSLWGIDLQTGRGNRVRRQGDSSVLPGSPHGPGVPVRQVRPNGPGVPVPWWEHLERGNAMRVSSFFDERRRRRLLTIGAASAVVVMAAFIGSALGVLSGSPSKFEAGDGNTIVDSAGNQDWITVVKTTSNPTGTVDPIPDATDNSDDSFVSGQKQDTECPGIDDSHGNPPKDDFAGVASFAETNNNTSGPGAGHTFLYGATVRDAANGNASENVELNKGENGDCPDGSLARTVGDKLIAIDYTGGGTTVTFNVLTWIDGTDTDNPTCFVGNDLPPCWGAVKQTLSASTAEGRVNTSTITAANNPITGEQLVAGKFAEFGIDLTAADIVPVGDCEPFAQTVFESRASGSSFVSTTKDVAINDHSVSNCGEIKIIKRTDPRGLNQKFTFSSGSATTLKLPADTSAGGVACGTVGTPPPAGVDASGNFCLNDSGNTTGTPPPDSAGNTVAESGLPSGTYTVTEGADPAGFAFDSLTCTGGGTNTTTSGKIATIGLDPNEVVTCVYINKRLVASSSSAQRWLPNDRIVLNATGGATLDGTLTATLYHGTFDGTGANCTVDPNEATAVSGQSYTFDTSPGPDPGVPDPSGTVYQTTNSTFFVGTNPDGSAGGAAGSSAGNYFWLIDYDDANLADPADRCESSNVTITD